MVILFITDSRFFTMCRPRFIRYFEPSKKAKVMHVKKRWKYTAVVASLAIMAVWKMAMANFQTQTMKLETQNQSVVIDHSNKSILARGCDPVQSKRA